MKAKALKNEFAFGLPGGANILGEFDPAGFLEGKDQDTVYKYREAELTHGRVAMLASLGFVVQEKFHPLFSADGGPSSTRRPTRPRRRCARATTRVTLASIRSTSRRRTRPSSA